MSVTDDLVVLRSTPGVRVYALGAVPASPDYPYIVIGYAPAAPITRDLGGSGDPEPRFTVQHFARAIETVEEFAEVTFETFDNAEIEPGRTCWQEVATPAYRDADHNGVLNITHTYRY